MNLDLPDIDTIIKINNLKPVTNPILFDITGNPTPDGLLSYEIFGSSTKQREHRFAYIDLYGKYLTPEAYKAFRRLNRNIDLIISGTETFKIDEKGKIVKDPDGKTGIKWLYSVWDKIKWEKSDSSARNERVDLLTSNKKDILFISKFFVFPALYRDINNQSSSKGVGEINSMYSKLMRYASMSVDSYNFNVMLTSYEFGVQQTLVEIYNHFKALLEKKNGALRKQLLGKSIDYSARLVITAPRYTCNDFKKDMPIDLKTTGVPMSAMCSVFFPFMVHWIRNYFIQEVDGNKYRWRIFIKNEPVYIKLQDPMGHFNDDYIKKRLKHFMKSYYDRFEIVKVPVKDPSECGGKEFVSIPIQGYNINNELIFERDLTWADLIYMAAVDVAKGKHILVTRYPLLNYFGSFPSKIHVLSTIETIHCKVNNTEYRFYPIIDLTKTPNEVSTIFQDSLSMSNLMLAGLKGDYDGDQVTLKSIFSQEANAEIDRIMNSPSFLLSAYGKNMRTTTKEGIEAMYMLTKR